MRTLWIVALAMALSGCTSDQADSPDEKTPDLTGPGGAETQHSGGGEGTQGNRLPLLTFSADVTQGNTPLAVNFTFIALDDDGDELMWRLDADGDGVSDASGTVGEQASAQFQYTQQGTFQATGYVHDGTDEVNATIEILVVDAEPIQTESASLTVPAESCGPTTLYDQANAVPAWDADALHGVTRVAFDVDTATHGRPFEATWTFDTGYLSLAYFFQESDGTMLEKEVDNSQNFGNYVFTGTVPDGAGRAVFMACGGPAQADFSYQA